MTRVPSEEATALVQERISKLTQQAAGTSKIAERPEQAREQLKPVGELKQLKQAIE